MKRWGCGFRDKTLLNSGRIEGQNSVCQFLATGVAQQKPSFQNRSFGKTASVAWAHDALDPTFFMPLSFVSWAATI